MDLETLNQRLDSLLKEQEQRKADFYVLEGQIVDCRFWIEKLTAKGEDSTPPKPHLVEG